MSDMKWAKEYLIDPLNAPDPSDETGPGTHFRSTFDGIDKSKQPADMTPPGSAKLPVSPSKNPFRNSMAEVYPKGHTRSASNPSRSSYPSPPNSAGHSPDNSKNPFESSVSDVGRKRQSLDSPLVNRIASANRSRGNSLGARFPGDQSNKPLDIIRRESKRAAHPPHLRKKHLPGPDVIDKLDATVLGSAYHHEGPYDATLLARNNSFGSSPVAAVQQSNEAALKATPRENVLDAIERHRPLDGVAIIPPGQEDRFGRRYDYDEGENMMIDLGGNYKRWPGMDYHPDDIKGKGEPQFSIDRARKEAKRRERALAEAGTRNGESGIEMAETARPKSAAGGDDVAPAPIAEGSGAEVPGKSAGLLGRSASVREGGERKHHFGGLKRRIGSLRKRLD